MFVGVLRLTLYLPDPGSLKSKRHLLRSALDRVKGKFNVSAAEVGANDLWQRAVVGVAAVGNDHSFVNETLDKVADFFGSMHGGQLQITDRQLEIQAYGGGGDDWTTLAEAEARAQGQAGQAWPGASGGQGGAAAQRRPPHSEDEGWGDDDEP